jgi:hypothetical protein
MPVALMAVLVACVASAQQASEQSDAFKARAMLLRASIAVKADKEAALKKFTAGEDGFRDRLSSSAFSAAYLDGQYICFLLSTDNRLRAESGGRKSSFCNALNGRPGRRPQPFFAGVCGGFVFRSFGMGPKNGLASLRARFHSFVPESQRRG